MMVCKIAEIQGYSKVVQIAALLHDVGKPSTRTINPQNNHVRFLGHEKVSVDVSIVILNQMVIEKMITNEEMIDIQVIILHHGDVYKLDEKTMCKKLNNNERLYTLLTQLSYCDNLGRFRMSADEIPIITD
jgi:putative nucleotidyltransferase with HDIG domain